MSTPIEETTSCFGEVQIKYITTKIVKENVKIRLFSFKIECTEHYGTDLSLAFILDVRQLSMQFENPFDKCGITKLKPLDWDLWLHGARSTARFCTAEFSEQKGLWRWMRIFRLEGDDHSVIRSQWSESDVGSQRNPGQRSEQWQPFLFRR